MGQFINSVQRSSFIGSTPLASRVPRLYPPVLAAGIHHMLLVEEAVPAYNLLAVRAWQVHAAVTAQRPRRAVLG